MRREAAGRDVQVAEEEEGMTAVKARRVLGWGTGCGGSRALRSALNSNPVLCLIPCVQRLSQPSYVERVGLLLLFLVTNMFLEHLALIQGPICAEAYKLQCGDFVFVFEGRHGGVPSADATGLTAPVQPGGALASANRSIQECDLRARDRQVPEEFQEAVERDTSFPIRLSRRRAAALQLLQFSGPLDCSAPMCDHWAPGELPLAELLASDYAHQEFHLHDGQSFAYVPGWCRCGQTGLQKATKWLAVTSASAVFSTLLNQVFQSLLQTTWDVDGGVWAIAHCVTLAALILLLALEMAALLVTAFLPEVWAISLGTSLSSAVGVSFLTNYFLLAVGLKSLEDDFRDETQDGRADLVGNGFVEASRSKQVEVARDRAARRAPGRWQLCCRRVRPAEADVPSAWVAVPDFAALPQAERSPRGHVVAPPQWLWFEKPPPR